jgi:DNA-binding MarR family transcriptional regulator
MKKPKEQLGFLVFDIARLLQRNLDARFAEAGMPVTVGEARTLLRIVREGALRQAALAERMHIEPMTLVGFLDRLEARGLIRRDPDPTDRRAKLVTTTAAAAGLVDRLEELFAGVRGDMTADLGKGDAGELRRLLQTVRDALDERDGLPHASSAKEPPAAADLAPART